MIAKKETVIRIVVEGPESSKKQALAGLLKEASQHELRDALELQSPAQLVRIAQSVHGRLYKQIRY